jgi:hypothetical protein
MKKSLVTLSLLLSCAFVNAAPINEHLGKQVAKLSELLSDGYAVGYPEGSTTQVIKRKNGSEITLVVFTVEGFGGGNNHTQYLAAFEKNEDANNKPYYSFLDVIPIGGKGWRGVFKLNAKVTEQKGGLNLAIDALQVGENDSPNFPSKKTIINVLYKDTKLVELK